MARSTPTDYLLYALFSTARTAILSLFFHEFGHLLYVRHRTEMDDLVGDLQEKISELLEPSVQRDDLLHQQEVKRQNIIVETWYEWAQELFCDAAGLVIGGTAFVYAFSMYMRMLGRGEYHLNPEELAYGGHPVTWLRIRLLAERARRIGYDADTEVLENTWSTIAKAMSVMEDYYGFYDPHFLPLIRQTIDDMLIEVSPRSFTEQEVSASEMKSPFSSPVHLLNQAWQRFLDDPKSYRAWEENRIAAFLAS